MLIEEYQEMCNDLIAAAALQQKAYHYVCEFQAGLYRNMVLY